MDQSQAIGPRILELAAANARRPFGPGRVSSVLEPWLEDRVRI